MTPLQEAFTWFTQANRIDPTQCWFEVNSDNHLAIRKVYLACSEYEQTPDQLAKRGTVRHAWHELEPAAQREALLWIRRSLANLENLKKQFLASVTSMARYAYDHSEENKVLRNVLSASEHSQLMATLEESVAIVERATTEPEESKPETTTVALVDVPDGWKLATKPGNLSRLGGSAFSWRVYPDTIENMVPNWEKSKMNSNDFNLSMPLERLKIAMHDMVKVLKMTGPIPGVPFEAKSFEDCDDSSVAEFLNLNDTDLLDFVSATLVALGYWHSYGDITIVGWNRYELGSASALERRIHAFGEGGDMYEVNQTSAILDTLTWMRCLNALEHWCLLQRTSLTELTVDIAATQVKEAQTALIAFEREASRKPAPEVRIVHNEYTW